MQPVGRACLFWLLGSYCLFASRLKQCISKHRCLGAAEQPIQQKSHSVQHAMLAYGPPLAQPPVAWKCYALNISTIALMVVPSHPSCCDPALVRTVAEAGAG